MSTLTRPTAEAPRLLLTARQAAEALALSPRTLWELTRRGDLSAIRVPGRGKARALRYAVEDLQRWIDRQKTATPPTDTGGVAVIPRRNRDGDTKLPNRRQHGRRGCSEPCNSTG